MKRIRTFLWQLSLYKKCPDCKGKLTERGFEDSNHRWECRCGWIGYED